MLEPQDPTVRFHEEQKFTQWWVCLVVCGTCLGLIVFFGHMMVRQLARGEAVGANPMSDEWLAIVGPLVILSAAAILVLLALAKLVTQVRDDGLYVRYRPFHLRERRIGLQDVEACEAVTYRPVVEYGGWGIRRGRRGRAYNVKGKRGVRLFYANGRHLLIGSQEPDELAAAINALRPEEA